MAFTTRPSSRPLAIGAAYAAAARGKLGNRPSLQRQLAEAAGLSEAGYVLHPPGRSPTRGRNARQARPGHRAGDQARGHAEPLLPPGGGGRRRRRGRLHGRRRPWPRGLRRPQPGRRDRRAAGEPPGASHRPVPTWPDFIAHLGQRAADARGESITDGAAEGAALLLDHDAAHDPEAAAKRVATFVVASVRTRAVVAAVPTRIPTQAATTKEASKRGARHRRPPPYLDPARREPDDTAHRTSRPRRPARWLNPSGAAAHRRGASQRLDAAGHGRRAARAAPGHCSPRDTPGGPPRVAIWSHVPLERSRPLGLIEAHRVQPRGTSLPSSQPSIAQRLNAGHGLRRRLLRAAGDES
jgi:hypothetical protein